MAEFEYFYEHGEANFGPPLEREVTGGAHLVFDVIPFYRNQICALRLPEGLHGDRKNALYFPHGLIRFGEKTIDCANRLCEQFAGVDVIKTELLWMSSWVDDNNHWHMCLNVLAFLRSEPRRQDFVSEIVKFKAGSIPNDFPWWTTEELRKVFDHADRYR